MHEELEQVWARLIERRNEREAASVSCNKITTNDKNTIRIRRIK